MKKSLFILFIFSSIFLSARLPDLIPYRKGKLWGYCDSTKKIIVECKYEIAKPFVNSGAIVMTQEKKWGVIDVRGQWLIKDLYSFLEQNKQGYYFCSNNFPWMYVYTPSGKQIINQKYFSEIHSETPEFKEGLVQLFDSSNCIGFYDSTGKCVIQTKLTNGRQFTDGLAVEHLRNGETNVVTLSGKRVSVAKKYYGLTGFACKRAIVYNKNGRAGYVDTKLKEVIPCRYFAASYFTHERAWVKNDEYGNWAMIDMNGKLLTKFKYSYMCSYSGDDIFEVVKCKYEDERIADWECTYNFVDRHGKELLDSFCTRCIPFSDGRAFVDDPKHGFKLRMIDTKGKYVSDKKFEDAKTFSEGKCWVIENGKGLGVIDLNGNYVIEPKYTFNNFATSPHPFEEGKFQNGIGGPVFKTIHDSPYFTVLGYIDLYGNEYWED